MKKEEKNTKKGRPYLNPSKKPGNPEELLNWAKESKNLKESRRFLLIHALMLSEGKLELKEVAAMFGVTPKTARDWVKLWNKGGKEALELKPIQGRSKKFTEFHREKAKELIEKQDQGNTRVIIRGIHGFLKGEIWSGNKLFGLMEEHKKNGD